MPVEKTRSQLERLPGNHAASQSAGFTDPEQLGGRVVFRIAERTIRLDVRVTVPGRAKVISPSRRRGVLEQAEREAWRRTLLVCKAKLEIVADGESTVEREFLADVMLPDGSTVHEQIAERLITAYSSGEMPPLLPARSET